MEPKTNPHANEYRICINCKDAWVENPVYSFCPSCMNDWYIELGYKPVMWFTTPDGITHGIADPTEHLRFGCCGGGGGGGCK